MTYTDKEPHGVLVHRVLAARLASAVRFCPLVHAGLGARRVLWEPLVHAGLGAGRAPWDMYRIFALNQ